MAEITLNDFINGAIHEDEMALDGVSKADSSEIDREVPEEEIIRKTYLLINNTPTTETTTLNDGTVTEMIDTQDFSIKEIPMDDIKTGQWFIFAEPTKVSHYPCVSVTKDGTFAYLCVKNNKDGSIEARTTFFDNVRRNELVGKINNMLEEMNNDA